MPFVAGQKPTAQEINDVLGLSLFAGEKLRESVLNSVTEGSPFPAGWKMRAAELNDEAD